MAVLTLKLAISLVADRWTALPEVGMASLNRLADPALHKPVRATLGLRARRIIPPTFVHTSLCFFLCLVVFSPRVHLRISA